MIPFDAPFFPNRIVFERGGTKRAGALAGELGAKRAFIVCGRTVAGNGMLDAVKTSLWSRFAGAFPQIESQNPLACVQRGAAAAENAGADLLVSIGGGSAMDGAKVIALMLKTKATTSPIWSAPTPPSAGSSTGRRCRTLRSRPPPVRAAR